MEDLEVDGHLQLMELHLEVIEVVLSEEELRLQAMEHLHKKDLRQIMGHLPVDLIEVVHLHPVTEPLLRVDLHQIMAHLLVEVVETLELAHHHLVMVPLVLGEGELP